MAGGTNAHHQVILVEKGLVRAHRRRMVDRYQTEAGGIARRPFQLFDQAPMEVTANGRVGCNFMAAALIRFRRMVDIVRIAVGGRFVLTDKDDHASQKLTLLLRSSGEGRGA